MICSLISERKEEREREGEKHRCEKHRLVASQICSGWNRNLGMCPDWDSNPQHQGAQDKAPPSWAIWLRQCCLILDSLIFWSKTWKHYFSPGNPVFIFLLPTFLVLVDRIFFDDLLYVLVLLIFLTFLQICGSLKVWWLKFIKDMSSSKRAYLSEYLVCSTVRCGEILALLSCPSPPHFGCLP